MISLKGSSWLHSFSVAYTVEVSDQHNASCLERILMDCAHPLCLVVHGLKASCKEWTCFQTFWRVCSCATT